MSNFAFLVDYSWFSLHLFPLFFDGYPFSMPRKRKSYMDIRNLAFISLISSSNAQYKVFQHDSRVPQKKGGGEMKNKKIN